MRGMFNFILDRLLPPDVVEPEPQPSLPEFLEGARQEWITARAYFDNVTDPTLVDHAIYLVQAAERRYSYLLRQLREQREAPSSGALPGAGEPANGGGLRDVGGLAGVRAAPGAPEDCAALYRPGEPSVPDPNRPPGRPAGPNTPGQPGHPARLDKPGAPGATRAARAQPA